MSKEKQTDKLLQAVQDEDLKRLKQVSKENTGKRKTRATKQNRKLFEAIRDDDLEKLNQAIKEGADINHIGKGRFTKKLMHSLSYAIECNSMACLEYLLDLGADYTMGEIDGEAAICLAAEKKNPKAITLLANAGANVNAKSKTGKTGLMLIINSVVNLRHGQQGYRDKPEVLESVQAFIKGGAHLDAQDAEGRTALMRAAFSGLSEIVETLTGAHAKTDIKDNKGNTALILATTGYMMNTKERLDCFMHLLEAGANVNAENDANATALYKSTYIPYPEVFEALVEAGANIDGLTEREQEAYDVLYGETQEFTDEDLASYAVANDHIVVKMDGAASLSQTFNFSKRTVTEIENGRVASETKFEEFKENKSHILAAYEVMQKADCKVRHPFPHMYRN